jgi:hypothetical protein
MRHPSIFRIVRHFVLAPWAVFSIATLAGCASGSTDPESTSQEDQGWDSQSGNPTHATHSYLTEFAIDQLSPDFPELATYRATIVDGANQELHELPVSDPEKEALREAAGGTNWACTHPEVVWNLARESYAAGDKEKAYWYVGIVLHWVEDMGVPAHAFHVYHQGSFSQRDNFELLGLQRWAPTFDSISVDWPAFSSPADYVEYNGEVTQYDFEAAFPGQTYNTRFFPMTWLFISHTQSSFVRSREGTTAVVAEWALYSAVTNF